MITSDQGIWAVRWMKRYFRSVDARDINLSFACMKRVMFCWSWAEIVDNRGSVTWSLFLSGCNGRVSMYHRVIGTCAVSPAMAITRFWKQSSDFASSNEQFLTLSGQDEEQGMGTRGGGRKSWTKIIALTCLLIYCLVYRQFNRDSRFWRKFVSLGTVNEVKKTPRLYSISSEFAALFCDVPLRLRDAYMAPLWRFNSVLTLTHIRTFSCGRISMSRTYAVCLPMYSEMTEWDDWCEFRSLLRLSTHYNRTSLSSMLFENQGGKWTSRLSLKW